MNLSNHFPPLRLLAALLPLPALARAEEPAVAAISLPALVQHIVAHNPERAFYKAAIEAAQAGRKSAGSLTNPELSIDFGRKRVTDASGTLAGEGNAWSVAVTQTFEWSGRLALRKSIANRDVEMAELGLARFENALVGRARLLAYGLHASHARAEAMREVAERFTVLKETFLARDPAGITPLLETRVIEAAELALQRRATGAELAVQAALIELNLLRGATPDAALTILAPELVFKDLPATPALVAAARENNFEFRLRRLELEQQGYAVLLARNDRYPAISVSPFLAQEKTGERETTFGVGISLPIPVTGRTRGSVDVAEARRRQAETVVFVAQRDLESEILTAALAYRTKLAETRRWSADAAQRFREAAQLADRHYRLGAVSIATYVELQNSYLDAVEALLDTKSETLAAGLQLQQLTGLEIITISQP